MKAFALMTGHPTAVRSLPLLPAQLGPEAGVVGAGWQVLRRRETEAA